MDGASGYDVTTAPEIDMKPKAYEHGTYRMNQLLQVTGGQNVPLSDTAISTSIFEIPAKVFNPSKSILRFRLDMVNAVLGSGIRTPHIHAKGYPMIDRIALYTRTGVYISDIVNCNYYTHLVAPYVTSLDQLQRTSQGRPEWQVGPNVFAANQAIPLSTYKDTSAPVTAMLSPSRPAAAGSDHQQDGFANAAATAGKFYSVEAGNMLYEALSASGETSDFRYRYQGVADLFAIGAGGATEVQALSLRYHIPLGSIPNSIWNLNRDLFFGETMIMQIYWSPTNKITWLAAPGGDAESALRQTFHINDLALYMAVETNRSIAESVVRQVATSGMRFTVPYVYTNRYTNPAGTQISVQIRLNRGHGKNLLQVYNGIYSPAAGVARTYSNKSCIQKGGRVDAVGFGPQKAPFWDYVYTMLDNERLQEINMDTKNDTDYLYQQENLAECAINTAQKYIYNWAWIDNWTGLPTCKSSYAAFAECGLDLQQERLYTFLVSLNATAAAGPVGEPYNDANENTNYTTCTIYQFIITQKTLTITPSQISIV